MKNYTVLCKLTEMSELRKTFRSLGYIIGTRYIDGIGLATAITATTQTDRDFIITSLVQDNRPIYGYKNVGLWSRQYKEMGAAELAPHLKDFRIITGKDNKQYVIAIE